MASNIMCYTGFLHSKEVLKLALIKIYLNCLIITNVLKFTTTTLPEI